MKMSDLNEETQTVIRNMGRVDVLNGYTNRGKLRKGVRMPRPICTKCFIQISPNGGVVVEGEAKWYCTECDATELADIRSMLLSSSSSN